MLKVVVQLARKGERGESARETIRTSACSSAEEQCLSPRVVCVCRSMRARVPPPCVYPVL